MNNTRTRSYSILEVSPIVFDEVEAKLREGGWDDALFHSKGELLVDMDGITLKRGPEPVQGFAANVTDGT